MPDARVSATFDRVRRSAALAGAVGIAACLLGIFLDPAQFFRSYLFGYMFWLGPTLGSAALLMLHHLVGGQWGFVSRRVLEAGTRLVPVMAVLFIPILAGAGTLYPWTHASHADELLRQKAAYLNLPFFVSRAVIYFAIWNGLAFLLNRWSLEQDRTGDPEIERRLQGFSGPGLILYGLTVTFAAVDWVMSLEPHWFSTIYGAIFMVAQCLSTLAAAILALRLLAPHQPLAEVVRPAHFHDLGTLMFAFLMLWAYVSFSQFLIIWAGNLPEESPWYVRRAQGGWQWLILVLFVFHFAAPFVLLLLRRLKRAPQVLAILAAWILAMRLLDLFWVIRPAFHSDGLHAHWLDFAAPLALGGVWMWFFARQLPSRPLLPLHDPRFEEAPHHA